jgi:long-chain acyl-CoA synthetase
MVPFGQRAPIDPASGVLSVGVPVPNTHCRVVGADGTLSGEAVGELEMQGPQIACGYWRNEKETHESFHDGWLKTGDLGRIDAAGWFYLVDRAKDVIVASGFKVWPRELELALESHPAIKEAAVVGVPDAYRGETPKAFVVLHEGAAASEALLRAYCRERLSPYKVPRFIEFVESLPRNHAGKLLRRQLRDQPHE